MPEVRLEQLTRRFADGGGVGPVELSIADRELMAILGPSGSGKTTLMRVIAGLDAPDSGAVFIGGEDVGGLAVGSRPVAMVTQDWGLLPHMTVRQNIAFPLEVKRRPPDETAARVEGAAASLGLTSFLELKPARLSAGHRQGVATGRAIVRDATVFLLDEPLSNVDAHARARIRTEVVARHRALEATTLYVTNDRREAMAMADRVVVLRDGNLQQVDTPQRVYEAPANLFVADFVGELNAVMARVEADGAGLVLQLGSRRLDSPVFPTALTEWTGHDVVVAVRPEALRFGKARPGDLHLGGKVVEVEFLGSDNIVHFINDATALDGLPESRFSALVRGDPPCQVGDYAGCVVAPSQFRFFDPETEAAVA